MFISLDPPQEGNFINAPTFQARKLIHTEMTKLSFSHMANKQEKLGLKLLFFFFFLYYRNSAFQISILDCPFWVPVSLGMVLNVIDIS